MSLERDSEHVLKIESVELANGINPDYKRERGDVKNDLSILFKHLENVQSQHP